MPVRPGPSAFPRKPCGEPGQLLTTVKWSRQEHALPKWLRGVSDKWSNTHMKLYTPNTLAQVHFCSGLVVLHKYLLIKCILEISTSCRRLWDLKNILPDANQSHGAEPPRLGRGRRLHAMLLIAGPQLTVTSKPPSGIPQMSVFNTGNTLAKSQI